MALIAIFVLILVAAALRGRFADTRDTEYSMRIPSQTDPTNPPPRSIER
jgi:hypothetical protein